ncbi:cupin domain-containing protein [Candidatus Thioglobus sp.]|jgi:50S ribosomal protein L16 3-hydroxylase|uniref:cupin domain-containing protein n=1 Tax=Candidatus Thioglobus sp. TaxID=2026721 RepID=UPI00176C4F54|nr:cupin domain-containing protein [Candidatus Thioglobus sp.]HIF46835.1 cupin domain-containing protein [Candidatus Thioglobus sp.]HIL04289.1 cupin domain-containing protein [Candidatus Thioglobus autotrophicus]
MIRFGKISEQEFLADYWQKKPLLIKQALSNFISPVAPDELAGLSLEEEFESRLIIGSTADQQWSLSEGPFQENDFSSLSENNWTLLVQGVDRFIPEIEDLIAHFDFIPRWRFDDVMISYAAKGGSVGPHFDFYDVFLLQGSGSRRWTLSNKNCHLDNYLKDVPLRIMDKFTSEQVFDVEPGDVLYVPPKVAHHGVSLDDNCTTLSFGYRSYSHQEMFKDLPQSNPNDYYRDPIWTNNQTPALIPKSAFKVANDISKISAADFAKFVTKLDSLDQKILQQFEYQQQGLEFNADTIYRLHSVCKIAYIEINNKIQYFVNGTLLDDHSIDKNTLINFCNQRQLSSIKHLTLSQRLFELNLVEDIQSD